MSPPAPAHHARVLGRSLLPLRRPLDVAEDARVRHLHRSVAIPVNHRTASRTGCSNSCSRLQRSLDRTSSDPGSVLDTIGRLSRFAGKLECNMPPLRANRPTARCGEVDPAELPSRPPSHGSIWLQHTCKGFRPPRLVTATGKSGPPCQWQSRGFLLPSLCSGSGQELRHVSALSRLTVVEDDRGVSVRDGGDVSQVLPWGLSSWSAVGGDQSRGAHRPAGLSLWSGPTFRPAGQRLRRGTLRYALGDGWMGARWCLAGEAMGSA